MTWWLICLSCHPALASHSCFGWPALMQMFMHRRVVSIMLVPSWICRALQGSLPLVFVCEREYFACLGLVCVCVVMFWVVDCVQQGDVHLCSTVFRSN
jgi:hypothetical protein